MPSGQKAGSVLKVLLDEMGQRFATWRELTGKTTA